jgi:hypothetical protein
VHDCIFIEPLESRVAPAGVVSFDYDPGTGELVLTGDEEANSIVISKTGLKTARIEGLDGTLIGEAAFLDVAKLTSISGTFGGALDSVVLKNLSVSEFDFDLGGAADFFSAENLRVNGETKLDFGAEGAAAVFSGNTTVLGRLVITTGGGDSSVSLNAVETKIRGAVEFEGGSGADSLTGDVASALTIGKGIRFIGNGGIDRLDFAGPGVTTIGKSSFDQSLLYSGWDSSEVSVQIRSQRVTLAGDVVVGHAVDSNYLRLGDPLGTVKVGSASNPRGINFSAGEGDSTFQLFGETVAVAGSIHVSGGTGVTKFEAVDVGKLTIGRDRYGNSIDFYGGSGDDEIQLRARQVLIAGSVDTSGHGGVNTIAIEGETVSIGRARNGISMFIFGYGSELNAERVELKGDRVTVKGTILLEGGEGGDVFDLTGIGVLSLHAINFAGNEGDDQILIEADRIQVSKQVGLSMDDGDDLVTISADGRINGYLFILLHDGATQRAEVSGRLASLQIGGELSISAFDSEYNDAKSADTILLRNLSLGGPCHLFPGAGNSEVSIDNLFARGELFVAMSDGNDTVRIETGDGIGPSLFRKGVKIWLWDGDDILQIGDSTPNTTPANHHARFLVGVEIDGGTGTNSVNADLLAANFFARAPVITAF